MSIQKMLSKEKHCSCCGYVLSMHHDSESSLCLICERIFYNKGIWEQVADKGTARVIIHCFNHLIAVLEWGVEEIREEIRRGH
jgi:hypothetical protein